MPSDTDDQAHEPIQSRPRVRFSFQLLLILAAVAVAVAVAAWFALQFARSRSADQIIARQNAVLDAIIENLVAPPEKATFKSPPGDREELQRDLGRSQPSEAVRRKAILELDAFPRTVSTSVSLDISAALAAAEPVALEEVAARLADHYARGLESAGLKRIVSGGGTNAVAVWESPDNTLEVLIHVDSTANPATANVSIIFIDSQRLSF